MEGMGGERVIIGSGPRSYGKNKRRRDLNGSLSLFHGENRKELILIGPSLVLTEGTIVERIPNGPSSCSHEGDGKDPPSVHIEQMEARFAPLVSDDFLSTHSGLIC